MFNILYEIEQVLQFFWQFFQHLDRFNNLINSFYGFLTFFKNVLNNSHNILTIFYISFFIFFNGEWAGTIYFLIKLAKLYFQQIN